MWCWPEGQWLQIPFAGAFWSFPWHLFGTNRLGPDRSPRSTGQLYRFSLTVRGLAIRGSIERVPGLEMSAAPCETSLKWVPGEGQSQGLPSVSHVPLDEATGVCNKLSFDGPHQ